MGYRAVRLGLAVLFVLLSGDMISARSDTPPPTKTLLKIIHAPRIVTVGDPIVVEIRVVPQDADRRLTAGIIVDTEFLAVSQQDITPPQSFTQRFQWRIYESGEFEILAFVQTNLGKQSARVRQLLIVQ